MHGRALDGVRVDDDSVSGHRGEALLRPHEAREEPECDDPSNVLFSQPQVLCALELLPDLTSPDGLSRRTAPLQTIACGSASTNASTSASKQAPLGRNMV